MKTKTALLFSDLKGFSSITDIKLRARIVAFNNNLLKQVLSSENSFYHNTWGDAFFICSEDSYDLAEIALKIRDAVKNSNWKKEGFPNELAVRIGLHIETISRTIDKRGKVTDVFGTGIDLTARIEPIVDPNEVFCSKEFRDHLLSNNYDSKIDAISIGSRQLAKNYAEKALFKLEWRGAESAYLNTKIEELYWYDRYTFHAENKIEFESFRVVKVISAKLERLPILTQWSGRGNFRITSAFFPEFTQQTDDKGNLNFDYPIGKTVKFGDTITIQYKYEAIDETGNNIPLFKINFRRKTEYFHLDIILRYKEYAEPAELEYLTEESGHFPKEVSQIPFDNRTKSYKFAIANPQLNSKYIIKWKK